MALVKQPLFSEEAHGALGGFEYRLCRGRHVVGRRSISTGLATQAQLQHRSLLQLAHAAWTALPLSVQAAWISLAPPPMTGRNCFIQRWMRTVGHNLDFPNPVPPAYVYAPITDLRLETLSPNLPAVNLLWDYTGTEFQSLLFFARSTWSHRRHPTLSQLTFTDFCGALAHSMEVVLHAASPVVHVLVLNVDKVSGALLQRVLLRLEPAWLE